MLTPIEIYHVSKIPVTYYSILNNRLFKCNHHDNIVYEYRNGKDIKILRDICLAHNFKPFIHNNIYYAIGGQENWKADRKWRDISYKDFLIHFKEEFGEEYNNTEEFYLEKIKQKFLNTPVSPYNRGLYLFKSDDEGKTFYLISEGPVISVNHPGFISALDWKPSEFDCLPEIIYYKKKWFLYIRANIGKDKRDIQVTTSKDLVNWTPFRKIKHNYREDDNYYHPIIIEFKRKLVGFFNYYNKDRQCLKIKYSKDGYNWIELQEFFVGKPADIDRNKVKTSIMLIKVDHIDTKFLLYLNHNYISIDPTLKNYIVKYSCNSDIIEKRIMEEEAFNDLESIH